MSAAKAKALGVKPLARIRGYVVMACKLLACLEWRVFAGYGDAAQAPIDFPTAPSKAVPIALKAAGVSPKDIEYHEVNEAFAAVVLANAKVVCLPL